MRLSSPSLRKHQSAFSIVEAVIGMTLLLLMMVAIYTGITFGLNTIRQARENTRATQILVEKTEQIRLFNWDQLTSGTNAFISTNEFIVPYYSTNLGIMYTGRVTIKPLTLPGVAYSNDMQEVTVSVSWVNGNMPRSRSLKTYVSRYGIQNYIY